jgi:hypothetical protein
MPLSLEIIIIILTFIHQEVLTELIPFAFTRIADFALLQVPVDADQSLQSSP